MANSTDKHIEEQLLELLESNSLLMNKFNDLENSVEDIQNRLKANEINIQDVHHAAVYGSPTELYDDEEYDKLVSQTQPPTFITSEPELTLEKPTQGNTEGEALEEVEPIENGRMTVWQHLEVLRWLIFKSIITLVITIGIGFATTNQVSKLIFHPIKELIKSGKIQVIYSTPTAAFFVQLKMAFLTGFILALPAILYFTWQFISPALKENEHKFVRLSFFIGFLCFLVGATSGYLFLHEGIPILLGFAMDSVSNLWPLGEYIGFCSKLILAFGIVFEMPILFGLLAMIGVTKAESLGKGRPYALIVILVVAALLTPPDVVSQLALGVPMFLLYEISILVTKVIEKKKSKASK